jgi:hypothetical protein
MDVRAWRIEESVSKKLLRRLDRDGREVYNVKVAADTV